METGEKRSLFFKQRLIMLGGSQLDHLEFEAIMRQVYTALEEKGYRPIDQIMGYIWENNPTYITSRNDARTLIEQVGPQLVLYEVLSYYFSSQKWLTEREPVSSAGQSAKTSQHVTYHSRH